MLQGDRTRVDERDTIRADDTATWTQKSLAEPADDGGRQRCINRILRKGAAVADADDGTDRDPGLEGKAKDLAVRNRAWARAAAEIEWAYDDRAIKEERDTAELAVAEVPRHGERTEVYRRGEAAARDGWLCKG